MNRVLDGYDMRLNMIMRRDIKEAMEVLRAKRCRRAGGNISLGRLFGEAAQMLLKREHISLDDNEYTIAKRPPASKGRPRKETAVA